ncbi:sensor domain-containing diguanylate cyclase [Bordetella bronchiseptica]|uniref:GGDEF domain-containing protein n=1 Tax=Bordetella bronchiseptica TaxID=518 RepID=UPI000459795C|nr:GGDEF domain-containing protein [Bordetella bronchiseptica]KAK52272.1 diguanylate cyclase (GGDEF) domain protein [Bordetella bronchiseptica OSU054]KDB79142.1 diguanylate cyclase (GGDEF) domain protein [Bordetella bronchiseptica CA90 BB1334]KDD41351.1 diguanylate cyclase (GGDEF) domain protein [Bordetella bronchiseptica OSU095]KDD49592.1 diguanylate cyclase (GGDEF) domain protein [Bordetella bronchiseptica MBORD901]
MNVDLTTLYLLATGTLIASAGMMLWEYRANPGRGRALGLFAAGFATLALGCVAALYRRDLPGVWGSALANLIMIGAYLLVLQGVGALRGSRHGAFGAAVLAVMAAVWALSDPAEMDATWSHVSAAPIALINAMTALSMWRNPAMRPFPARRMVIAMTGLHALIYAGRALVLPWLVREHGLPVQALAGKFTIYEGVLYSVILPMALLRLLREEIHGELLRESQTDYLTRLGNRRWFFEEGARLLKHRPAGSSPLAVLAFDLDQFKAINDMYGHQTGDEVLQAFARAAQDVIGPRAVLARIGGEEFAALLRGDDALKAQVLGQAVAGRFTQAVAGRLAHISLPVTVSIGLACIEPGDATLAASLMAADRAMYRAKSLGGNRLEIAAGAA